MGPSSAQKIHLFTLLGRVFALPLLLSLASCDQSSEPPEEPTEPWLKEDAEQTDRELSAARRFQVADSQQLEISLPTRKHQPTGTLHGISGHVDLHLKDLAKTTGRIVIALDSLKMNEDRSNTNDQLAHEPVASTTTRALRWLGLGEAVSPKEKKQNATATFEFNSLRALSHQSAHMGQRKKKKDGGIRRQVYATADGELSLRGLSVKRKFTTILHFHYPPESTPRDDPESVEVTLRGDARIPLAEYEIVPRGQEGHAISDRRKILGNEVGSTVKVSGSLRFERAAGP